MLAALARLRDQGVVVGLSSSGPGQAATIRRALELSVGGDGLPAPAQATWNPLEPSAGLALAEASAAGWGVIVKEAVANGRLTPHGSGPEAAVLGRVAARYGVGVGRPRWPPSSPTPGPAWSCRAPSPPPSRRPTCCRPGRARPGGAGGAGRPGRAAGPLLAGALGPLLVLSGAAGLPGGRQPPGGRLGTGRPSAMAATQSRSRTAPLVSV